MQFRPIFAGIAGASALAAAGVPAFAQTAGETAAKWGLPGEWKLDCKSPASQRNQAIEFIVRDGKLLQERSAGSVKDVTTLTSAVARPDGSLETVEVSASTPPTTRQIVRRRHGRWALHRLVEPRCRQRAVFDQGRQVCEWRRHRPYPQPLPGARRAVVVPRLTRQNPEPTGLLPARQRVEMARSSATGSGAAPASWSPSPQPFGPSGRG
jgi:hypothetical protein